MSNPWKGSCYKVYRNRKATSILRKAPKKATGNRLTRCRESGRTADPVALKRPVRVISLPLMAEVAGGQLAQAFQPPAGCFRLPPGALKTLLGRP